MNDINQETDDALNDNFYYVETLLKLRDRLISYAKKASIEECNCEYLFYNEIFGFGCLHIFFCLTFVICYYRLYILIIFIAFQCSIFSVLGNDCNGRWVWSESHGNLSLSD